MTVELDTAVDPDADGLVGGVTIWPSNVLPGPKYQFAAGQAVSRTVFSLLFARYGTLHGVGDGSTTFNLPTLVDKLVRGTDGSTGVEVGTVGGTTAATMPAHGHTISGAPGGTFGSSGHTHSGTTGLNSSSIAVTVPGSGNAADAHDHTYTTSAPSATASPTAGTLAADNTAGSGDNWPPHVRLRHIIKVS